MTEPFLRELAERWSWSLGSVASATDRPKITVNLADREVSVVVGKNKAGFASTLMTVLSGVYGVTPFAKRFVECVSDLPDVKVTYETKGLVGPKYWANSCPVDSVLAIIAFSTGISWRALMESSTLRGSTKDQSEIMNEVYLPKGRCSVTRKALVGGSTVMRRAGEIYDLLTDRFPSLKFPVAKYHSDGIYSRFYSTFPLEDFLEGNEGVVWNFNTSLLVLENNLSFANPESLKDEPDRPKKIRKLGLTIFDGDYELCGVVYQSGVAPTGTRTLEEIFEETRLGSHYYAMIKLPDQKWYLYDDLNATFELVLTNKFSYFGKDPGVLFFYQRRTPLKKEKVVVSSDLTLDVSLSEVDQVVGLGGFTTADYLEDRILVTFPSVANRTEFEAKIRK